MYMDIHILFQLLNTALLLVFLLAIGVGIYALIKYGKRQKNKSQTIKEENPNL